MRHLIWDKGKGSKGYTWSGIKVRVSKAYTCSRSWCKVKFSNRTKNHLRIPNLPTLNAKQYEKITIIRITALRAYREHICFSFFLILITQSLNHAYLLVCQQYVTCLQKPSFYLLVWEIVWLIIYNSRLCFSLNHISHGINPNLQVGFFTWKQSLILL